MRLLTDIYFDVNLSEEMYAILDQYSLNKRYAFIIDNYFRKTTLPLVNIEPSDIIIWYNATKSEPQCCVVDKYVNKLKNENIGLIVGVGGGSTMDIAKAVSVMLTNSGNSNNYQGYNLVKNKGVPCVCMPTLFGAGAELTQTAVLISSQYKFGINSSFIAPKAAIIDFSLQETAPLSNIIYTLLDCFVHCAEIEKSKISPKINKEYASLGIKTCKSIFSKPNLKDSNVFEEICLASILGGLSLLGGTVGLCHALSYMVSNTFGIRHSLSVTMVFHSLLEEYGEYVNNSMDFLSKFNVNISKLSDIGASHKDIDKMGNYIPLFSKLWASHWGNDYDTNSLEENIKYLLVRCFNL